MTYFNINPMYHSGTKVDKFQKELESARFMLSASDNSKVAWIRRPFINHEELNKFLQDSIEQFPRYTNIEIYNEETLDEHIKVESKSGEWIELTLRDFLFGKRYQSYAEHQRNPEKESPVIEFMIGSNQH
jgi:hypothetical protein